jgi:hypothetical protein
VAPRRGAEAQGARAPHGLPRDHEGRDHARALRDTVHRRSPRRRAGDEADPRPTVWVRGLAGPVEEGHTRTLGRPGPVGRDAPRRRARTRTHGIPLGGLLGSPRDLRSGLVRGPPGLTRRRARRTGKGLCADHGRASRERRRAPRRATSEITRDDPRGCDLPSPLRRGASVQAQACRSVSHRDPAAGGEPQAPLLCADDHASRSAAVRVGLHHVHAD